MVQIKLISCLKILLDNDVPLLAPMSPETQTLLTDKKYQSSADRLQNSFIVMFYRLDKMEAGINTVSNANTFIQWSSSV